MSAEALTEARRLAQEAVDTIGVPPGADPGWRHAATLALKMADAVGRLIGPEEPSDAAHVMLDQYGTPRCGDIVHRINELGQALRRAEAALHRMRESSVREWGNTQ